MHYHNNKHLATLLNNVLDGIIDVNHQGIIQYINPAIEKIFGYTQQALIGQNITLLMPAPTVFQYEKYIKDLSKHITKIIDKKLNVTCKHKGGSLFSAELIIFQNNEAHIITGIIRDLSEKIQIKEKQNRFDAILHNIIDGIIIIDEKGIIESVNTTVEKTFKYQKEELIGQNIKILMPEPYYTEHDKYIKNYIETGSKKMIGIGREVYGRKKNGAIFPIEISISEFFMHNKRMFSGLIKDISERIYNHKKLEDALLLQKSILDSANVTVIATNLNGIITIFNAAAEKMLGYAAREILLQHTPEIFHKKQEIEKRALDISQEIQYIIQSDFNALIFKAKNNAVDESEWTYIRKDGSSFPALISITALKDLSEQVIGYLFIGADITQRKQMDIMKSEFISTVSHELRTPLTSIQGSLGLIIGSQEIPAKTLALLNIANKNAKRLTSLINDILDIEKIEAGKMDFYFEVILVKEFIDYIIQVNTGYASQYHVELKQYNFAPEAKIQVDRGRLEQVLSNLISNACKYSNLAHEVSLIVEREGDNIKISVKDYGEGIADAFQTRIFQKFAQGDGSDSRVKGGTGLGLSISKAIIEQMYGSIDFESIYGQGSTFFFYLPEYIENIEINGKIINDNAINLKKKYILICEDDNSIANLLKIFLEKEGFITEISHTAQQAYTLLTQHPDKYQAMTLDLVLPDQDGITFLNTLRKNEKFKDFPVIIVSVKTQNNKKDLQGDAFQVIDWISKPIDTERLLSVLQKILINYDQKAHLLHIEDDNDIYQIIKTVLEDKVETIQAKNLEIARKYLKQHCCDLILLDIQLPDGSGFDFLLELNMLAPNVPVIIFSAQQIPKEIAQKVNATMIKAKTSNEILEQTILQVLNKR